MKTVSHIVGLTGGMGAGKSTLVPIIREAGIPVLDMDGLVREIYEDEMFCMDLDDEWGVVKGEDVKAQMAAMITQYPDRLPRLEEIISPWIDSGIKEFVAKNVGNVPFVVFDAPLLFEGNFHEMCDFVIGIQCPREIREERVMERPGMSREKMTILMDRQIGEYERANRSNFAIDTSLEKEVSRDAMSLIIDSIKKWYETQ